VFKESILKLLKLDGLIENVTGYVEARIELLKLDIKEDLAHGLAKVAVYVVLALAFMIALLLFSMAVAFKIGDSLGNFAGFGIVAGAYFLIGLILLLFQESISATLEKKVKELMTKKKK
jgi:hypothetical protein